MGISIFKIEPTISFTGETYIGTLVTLLGIIVTFVVGYQIYNVLEFKSKIMEQERRQKDIQIQIEKLNSDVDKKIVELKKQEKKFNQIVNVIDNRQIQIFMISLAEIETARSNFIEAIGYYLSFFRYATKMKGDDYLSDCKVALKNIKKSIENLSKHDFTKINIKDICDDFEKEYQITRNNIGFYKIKNDYNDAIGHLKNKLRKICEYLKFTQEEIKGIKFLNTET